MNFLNLNLMLCDERFSFKKSKPFLTFFFVTTFFVFQSFAQEIPLVYAVENTGTNYPKPILPSIEELPSVEPLTDPFIWSDGSKRDTSFASWAHRRSEIKAEIEFYEIGEKATRPDSITASYAGGMLTVIVTRNGKTLTLTSPISLPAGEGSFPAIIGMNSGTGSLPSDIFTSRKIATIAFMHDQVTSYSGKRESDPFFKLYPELFYGGQYSQWAWGVSRIIDGLELLKDVLPIDLKHLAVTGCSYAGKMALFAGALDERIALTIPQESGGGGAAAWRVSQTLGSVESISVTNSNWFMPSMFRFGNKNISKLPHDHHELLAMVAPRALFVLGNPDYGWLADEAGYVSCRAAHQVWNTFGIGDRMGFSILGGHGHCALPNIQKPEVEAFVDKFMLGDTTVNTNITTNTYPQVDYAYWTDWWGTEKPVFPERDKLNTESIWLEVECATVGRNFTKRKSATASNNYYIGIKTGMNNLAVAPTDSASTIYIPFTVTKDTTYHFFANVMCLSTDDDAYWVKLDDGDFKLVNNLLFTGWHWLELLRADLKAGDHKLTIANCEDGAYIDKLCISSNWYAPVFKGNTASNLCDPTTPPVGVNTFDAMEGYGLEQNYPNPANGKTFISFEIPSATYVSLKVYNAVGAEIEELAGKDYSMGKHTLEFDARQLTKGIYFYTIKADNFSLSKKMILQGE